MTQKEVKIQTAFGEYKVEYVYQTEMDYFAVTGRDFTQRTFMIDGNKYRRLKAELEA
jgi:FKBP-type peptidyl-prolyl cis-trans isomerase 2